MSDDSVKRIPIKEFREFGFLQEVNRQFLHPLGLALEVIIDEKTGEERLGGVWDYRDDLEGMIYGDVIINSKEADGKAIRVEGLRKAKAVDRLRILGYRIQPIDK